MGNKNIKQDLMTVTIALMQEKGARVEDITVRDIAGRAGVGVGLVNYHFQSKERLIELCVQSMITKVVERVAAVYQGLDMPPSEKLRHLAKMTCTYLAENENLSRISILTDFR